MFKKILNWIASPVSKKDMPQRNKVRNRVMMEREVKILKTGPAMRVIFFYPGEEGTYVDHPEVTLYENGIVHIHSNQEETTTHLQNCEILWNFELEAEDRTNKVRLLKPKSKSEQRSAQDLPAATKESETHESEAKPSKNSPSQSPELG